MTTGWQALVLLVVSAGTVIRVYSRPAIRLFPLFYDSQLFLRL